MPTDIKAESEVEVIGDSVVELVGAPPGWFLKSGNTFLLLFILTITLIAFFIKYPTSIYTNGKLISINAPKTVVAKTTGKIKRLFVKEGDLVEKGNLIGYLESDGNADSILVLYNKVSKLLELLTAENVVKTTDLDFNKQSELGELQPFYEDFVIGLSDFENSLQNGLLENKKKVLLQDLNRIKELKATLIKKRDLVEDDIQLIKKTYEDQVYLNKSRIVSDYELRTTKSVLINKEQGLYTIQQELIQNDFIANDKLRELIEIDNMIKQKYELFVQIVKSLKSKTLEWINTYVLMSPVKGKVSLVSFVQENQNMKVGEIVCFVGPEATMQYLQMYIPEQNMGKVRIGQKVLISFPAYPYQEYGKLSGEINYISNIKLDSGYLARVSIKSFDSRIVLSNKENMAADIEIITSNSSLFDRILNQIVVQN